MIVIGSRGSKLALAQTGWVRDRILSLVPGADVTIKVIKTSADKNPTASIRAGSSIGVFVKEIEEALKAGDIDIAVHSMKDLPTATPPGLRIAAVPEREDPRDAFICARASSVEELPAGAVVGTGSIRRQAQLLALRPDLRVVDIRGNIDTRLKRLEEGAYDALILACAGLRRLGLDGRISSVFELPAMLPAPGQGALAIETRDEESAATQAAGALNHPATAAAVAAERRILQRMGGGCNVPVGVHASVTGDAARIEAVVASADGRRIIRDFVTAPPDGIGEAADKLADRILALGGRVLLDELRP